MSGAGAIAATGANGLLINQSTARGIIDWRSFSIGAGGAVSINNGAGVTLNRVTGGQLSSIEGMLSATGSVYLVNPQGVVVGPGGQVLSGGSVVLSSRDIGNDAFMAGAGMTAAGTSVGDVTNKGTVLARTGDVVIIGHSVANTGLVQAANGAVTLAAGNTVVLAPVGGVSGVVVAADSSATGDVTEAGRVEAAAAALTAAGGNVYSLAGSNGAGLVQATGTATIGGHVYLTAPNGAVSVAGTALARNADGSGGQIIASGKAVALASTATLDASGTQGGQVLVGVTAPQTNLADTTTISDGAQILAGGPGGGGHIETSGHTFNMGAASISAGNGGSWLIDPTDLTVTDATTYNASLALGTSTTITTSGNLTISTATPIAWSTAAPLSISGGEATSITSAITGTGTGGLTVTSGAGAITIAAAISANTVSMTATGGNLAINSGSITGRAAGATAVTLNTTANFVNSAGSGAVAASGAGGNWRVYSTDPSLDTTGGLAANFYQYNAPIGAAANGAATGNGLLYSLAPSVTYGLTGSVTKVYDGASSVTGFTSANLSATGLVNSDSIAASGAAVYSQTWDVGTSLLVSIPGVTITHAGKAVYGYGLSGTLTGVIGAVTPANASVNLTAAPTKTYDSSTAAVLASGDYQVTGVNGEVITVGQASSVNFDSPEAGTGLGVTINFANTSFVAGSGVSLSNYTLPTTLHVTTGIINPAPVKILGISAPDMVYNGGSTVTLNTANIHLFGLVNPGDVTLDTNTYTGTFMLSGNPTANVGSGLTVASNIAFTHTGKWQDYTLVAPAMTASITKLGIDLEGITGAQNKTYDGTTAATLIGTPTLVGSGLLAGDATKVSLNTATAAANFVTANAGTNISVVLSNYLLAAGGGGDASGNYSLILPSFTADIAKAQLSMALALGFTGSKVYDGSADGTVDATSFLLTGWATADSEGGHLSQTTHVVYSSPDVLGAGNSTVTTNIALTDVVPNVGTSMQNYLLPAPLVFAGTITPAPITVSIIGNPTKVFDGTAAATLNPATNYDLEGFVTGQSATVTQTAGTYLGSSGNAGSWTVSANLAGFLTAGGGTSLSNYSFPSTATGAGTITRAPVGMNVNTSVTGGKVYDGTVNLFTTDPTAYTFSFTGLTAGDQSAITILTHAILSGSYGSANAGVQTLTLDLDPTVSNDFGGINLSNYIFQSTVGGIGTITKAPITLGLTGTITKVYNGSTDVFLSPANVTATGFVAGQGITVNQLESAAYDSALASGTPGGATKVTGSVQLSDLTPTGGALLSNYNFQNLSFQSAATITKAPVSILGLSANSKVYNQDNLTTLTSGATLFGVIAADLSSVNLSYNTAGATFSQVDVGSGLTVTPNGAIALAGTASQNYSLTVPTLTANITPRSLTVSGITIPDLVYNNTTLGSISGTAQLNGVLGGDSVTLVTPPATATFAQKNVGNNIAVTIGGYGLAAGGQSGDYTLTQPGGFTANITPRPLSVALQGNLDKIYDGTAIGYLTQANFLVSNFATGEGGDVNINQAYSTLYDSSHATVTPGGATTLTATLVLPDYHSPTTDLSNYTLPLSVSHAATITPAPLTAQIINNPTKTFDNTSTATLTTNNLTLLGFVNSSQGASVTTVPGTVLADYFTSSGGSMTPNAGVITVKTDGTSLSNATFTANAFTTLTDYSLPTVAIGGGTITPLQLSAAIIPTISKVYDGTTAATGLVPGDYSLLTTVGGFALPGGQSIVINKTTGTYASKDVGTPGVSTSLASGDFASGNGATTLLSNYILPTSAVGPGQITARPLTLSLTKVYDGGNSLTGATVNLVNVIGGDSVALAGGLTGSYDGLGGFFDVGTGLSVTLANVGLINNSLGDYSIATGFTSQPFGAITKRNLTATLAAQTKTYNGNTAALGLTPASFVLGNLVSGETAEVDGVTTGQYASKEVAFPGNTVTSSAISSGDFTATGGTHFLASNYNLPTSAVGPGTITQAVIELDLTKVTKVYDGTLALPTSSTGYTLNPSEIFGSDVVDVASAVGSYATSHVNGVGSPITMNFTSVTLGGAQASDYKVNVSDGGAQANGAAIGFITPATLTLQIVNNATKAYDGTNAISPVNGGAGLQTTNFQISGLQNGETAGVDNHVNGDTAHFDSANVVLPAGHNGITLTGASAADIDFNGTAQSGDYVVASTATGFGTITPLALTVTLANQTKVYDSLTNATINTADYGFSGYLAGEAPKITQTTGAYTSPNVNGAGGSTVDVNLAAGDYAAATGSNFIGTNYVLPTSVSNTTSTITPRTLTATFAPTTRAYNGTITTATLTGFSLGNFVGGDTGLLTSAPATTTYGNADVQTNSALSVGLGGSGFTTSGILSNYQLPATATGLGSITPLQLTAVFDPITKIYDGGGAATGLTDFLASGFIGAGTNTGAITTTVTTGTYQGGPFNVGAGYVVDSAGLTGSTFALAAGASGTLADYSLPSFATGTGAITKRTLTATFATTTRAYDTTNVTSILTGFSLGNFVGLDAGTITNAPATTTYPHADVQAGTALTAGLGGSGFTTSVGLASNYQLPVNATGLGSITPFQLTAVFDPITKTFDNTTNATGLTDFLASGFFGAGTNTGAITTAVTTGAYQGGVDVSSGDAVHSASLAGSTFALASGTIGTLADYALPSFATGTGAITPRQLTASFNPVTKVYDSNNSATGLANFAASGFIGTANTGAITTGVTTGTYQGAGPYDVASGYTVRSGSLTGSTFALASGAAGTLADYSLPAFAIGTGAITPLQLTASFADTTKIYDQTLITSPLTGYVLAGFIGAQGGTISNAPVTGLYGVKDVTASPQALTVSLSSASFNLTGGANAIDYIMPATASGLGTITQAPLHVSGVTVFNKVYDGTTAATLNTGGASGLTGVFTGDQVTLNVGPNAAQFVSPNVGNGVTVNLSGGSITGQDSGDYFLVQLGALAANITPKALTLSLADQTKVYDGNTTAAGLSGGSYTLSGLVGSQTATVDRTAGAYNSPNVADAVSVTVGSLTAGDYIGAGGFLASNYALPTSVTGAGTITPASLTAVIIGTPTKVFDGTNPAVLTPANFQLTGFVGGEGAGVNQTVGTYANPAAGPEGVTAQLGAGNFAPTGGTLLSNYLLPNSASGLGLITAAAVTTPTRPTTPTGANTEDTITGFLRSIGVTLTPQLLEQIREAAFTVADVRTYIPYPAPGALSSWRNNGWGTLPIVIDDTTDYTQSQDDDGNRVVQSGAPVINSTEQVMEQGVKNKRWRITIPRFAAGPALFVAGPVVAVAGNP